MAKWLIPHLKGQTESLPDGSKVVNGFVETNDDHEPKVSKILREYYGAVKAEPTESATAQASMTASAPAPGTVSPVPGAADPVKASK